MQKNISKYFSYKIAWDRIKKANEDEYYFESIAICESIISDRLLSYLIGIKSIKSTNQRYINFSKLINLWSKNSENLPSISGVELDIAVDKWKEKRNKIIHGLAKSFPGTPTEDTTSFLKEAEQTAIEGAKIARAVCNWHRTELAKYSHKS